MARVKRGVVANRSHKKVLKAAKGYYGARSRVFRVAKQAVIKAGQYAYRDRRVVQYCILRLREVSADAVGPPWQTTINGGNSLAGPQQSSWVGG